MQSQSTKIERVCEHCGAKFLARVRAVRIGQGRFCSRNCARFRMVDQRVELFWSSVDKSGGKDACWPWTSDLGGPQRRIRFNGKLRSVRQIAWELGNGRQINRHVNVKVICGNVLCCNPAHLEYFDQEDPERFWKMADQSNGPDSCWNWTGDHNRHGYGLFYVHKKTVTAHRMAYRLAFGEIPEGLFVLHGCDNRSCVNPAHLRAGTHEDNMRDMISRGRQSRKAPPLRLGEKAPSAVLTEEQVREIRQRRANGELGVKLAKEFGVTPENISSIVLRKSWEHVA